VEERPRVRFAPAPTGALHVGGARTALFNWLFARNKGGAFVLRIEDTDRERSQPAYLEQILQSLSWLGLDWDEGPGVGGDFGPYLQSERLQLYRQHLEGLLASGQAYRCYCSKEELAAEREEQAKRKQAPRYSGRCRHLPEAKRREYEAQGRPYVCRFRMKDEGQVVVHDLIRGDVTFDVSLLDDFVVFKSDGFPTFLMANVVDDEKMRISHVIRGEDHLSNTPRLIVLREALGFDSSLKYAHVPMLLSANRAKLSKREGAMPLLDFRDQGYLPSAVRNFLALLGWSPGGDEEILTDRELVEKFSLEGVSKSGAVFDLRKLEWMNAEHLRKMPTEELLSLAVPYLQRDGLLSSPPDEPELDKTRQVVELMRERMKSVSQLPQAAGFFFRDPAGYEEKAARKWFSSPQAGELLRGLAQALDKVPNWNPTALESAAREFAEQTGLSAAEVIHPARLAVTGVSVGPSLFHLMAVVGRNDSLRRLRKAADAALPRSDAAC